jgi:hypothetical protein
LQQSIRRDTRTQLCQLSLVECFSGLKWIRDDLRDRNPAKPIRFR